MRKVVLSVLLEGQAGLRMTVTEQEANRLMTEWRNTPRGGDAVFRYGQDLAGMTWCIDLRRATAMFHMDYEALTSQGQQGQNPYGQMGSGRN